MEHDRGFQFLLAALATWRLTHLLAEEDGPGDLIFKIRKALGGNFFGQLMDCFYCLSLWVAAIGALSIMKEWRELPILWVALSGAACLLERATKAPPAVHRISKGE